MTGEVGVSELCYLCSLTVVFWSVASSGFLDTCFCDNYDDSFDVLCGNVLEIGTSDERS